MRWWVVGVVMLLGGCQNQPEPKNAPSEPNQPILKKTGEAPVAVAVTEESAAVSGAMQEFFSSRWPDWSKGEFVAVEPMWGDGQFQSFDKALEYWTTKFGNDGAAGDEETLKRVKSTLDAAGSPASPMKGSVEKGLESMELDQNIVIVPSTYFNNNEAWVPGAVPVKNRSGKEGGIRVKGVLCYPLFSGDGRYAFVQMNRVKSGSKVGQLHFFVEKGTGTWHTVAVGWVIE